MPRLLAVKGEAMEFHLYTCRHCGYEAYYLEAMLRHQAEKHPKPVTANAEVRGATPIGGASLSTDVLACGRNHE